MTGNYDNLLFPLEELIKYHKDKRSKECNRVFTVDEF